jgi:hypothetical protein
LQTNPEKDRTHAFRVPFDFTEKQIRKGLKWWKKKEDSKKWYGYTKLLTFLWLVPMRPFMKKYYEKKGRPYTPKINFKKSEVCSVAVDRCLKHMGYDMFPEFDERVTWPGLFAEKLKKHKVNV